MSILKIKRNKGEVYRVRVFHKGIIHSKTFNRLYDAKQFEREVKFSGSTSFDLKTMFSQAADEWLKNHAEVRKAPKSVATDRQMLRDNLIPAFGSIPLIDVTSAEIERMIMRLQGRDLKATTINRNLELVRTIFNYCIKRRKALHNPMTAIGLLKVQTPPIAFWTEHEARKFLNYTEEKYRQNKRYSIYLLYKLALNTGMRLGELLGLSWHDVDLENRLITVCRSYDSHQRLVKEMTKGRKIRHVPINSAIYDDLRALKGENGQGLVLTTTGKPLDAGNVSHDFVRDVIEAEVKRIRFHDLRHTYASHFMMNGGDLFHLKEILGHSDIKTTMRYAHLSKSFLANKADMVSFDSGSKVVRVNFGKAVGDE